MTDFDTHVFGNIDTTRPSSARMYDYWLGGSHNFAVDRAAADQMTQACGFISGLARHNRSFVGRAVRFMSDQGIRQFIDIGSGIPTAGNVHEIAQAVDPCARVVYVDRDPTAVVHARGLLRDNSSAGVIEADLRDPAAILDNGITQKLVDFSKPVGLIFASVLHFVVDDDEVVSVVDRLRERLCAGSYLAISHSTTFDNVPAELAADSARLLALYNQSEMPLCVRTIDSVRRFFGDMELIEPGLVHIGRWRPDDPSDDPVGELIYAGVGRKP